MRWWSYTRTCEQYPNYVTPTFNMSLYQVNSTTDYIDLDFDGYSSGGYIVNTTVALFDANYYWSAANNNSLIFVANNITDNRWFWLDDGYSGHIGFGSNSPVWGLFGWPGTGMFDIYVANMNNWTAWINTTYVPATTSTTMTLNGFNSAYNDVTEFITIKPNTQGGYKFATSEFSFGRTYANNTTSYRSINNQNSRRYQSNTNTTIFSMNYRGIGLTAYQFRIWADLLNIVTQGEAACVENRVGFCSLPNSCATYWQYNLWEYDFKIQFSSSGDDQYLRIPLSSFAEDDLKNDVCNIYVEFLPWNYHDDVESIILGTMFFQSVYTRYTYSGVSQTSVQLYKNLNALDSTYLGN
jgi:hypothetical protein